MGGPGNISSGAHPVPPPVGGAGTVPEQPDVAGPSHAGPSGVGQYWAVPVPPAPVQGLVDGQRGAPLPLAGRVEPASTVAVGNPVALAMARDVRRINDLINQIERSRPRIEQKGEIDVDGVKVAATKVVELGELPPETVALITQLDTVVYTSKVVTDGDAGRSAKEQVALLEGLAGTKDTASDHEQGLLGEKMRKAEELLAAKAAGNPESSSAIKDLQAASREINAWTGEVRALARQRISYLAQQLESSPFSLADHHQTRASINAAAEKMLDEVIATTHDNDKKRILEEGRERFSQRKQSQLGAAKAVRGEAMSSAAQAGVKRLNGLKNWVLHPLRVREERAASELYATQLAYGPAAGAAPAPLDTPRTNELSVVEDALRLLLKKAGLPTAHVPHALEQKIQDQIDANSAWREPVETRIRLPDPPHEQIGRSRITPAPALLPKSYDNHGVNSHRSAEAVHATNLAHTQLATADGKPLFGAVRHGVLSAYALTPKGVGRMSDEELWQAIKPLSKFPIDEAGIKQAVADVRSNPEETLKTMRAQANKNRALEVVTFTVMTNPKLREAVLNGERGLQHPIDVDLLSVSLLTPDSFRRGADDNESLMLADQVNAWQDVSGEQFLQIPDGDGEPVLVKVNVKPVVMNYGVNQGAVKGVGGIRVDAVTGWHISDPLNEQGLRALFDDDIGLWEVTGKGKGILASRIDALDAEHTGRLMGAMGPMEKAQAAYRKAVKHIGPEPDLDQAVELEALRHAQLGAERLYQSIAAERNDQRTTLGAALELQRQIAAIRAEGAHRTAGNEPYKMPTRLAVLAELLGVSVAFNCKSGKDRTGELDAEVKHFKLQMQLTGKVPDYQRTRTPKEARQFYEVVTSSGNFEMQRLNTGYAGYKLHGVPELFSQFGGQPGDELTQQFHGLSGFTAS